jgi:hypothetical protein
LLAQDAVDGGDGAKAVSAAQEEEKKAAPQPLPTPQPPPLAALAKDAASAKPEEDAFDVTRVSSVRLPRLSVYGCEAAQKKRRSMPAAPLSGRASEPCAASQPLWALAIKTADSRPVATSLQTRGACDAAVRADGLLRAGTYLQAWVKQLREHQPPLELDGAKLEFEAGPLTVTLFVANLLPVGPPALRRLLERTQAR